MDITFKCPSCEQELEVDASGAGSEIECPACSTRISVPFPEPALVVVAEDGAVPAVAGAEPAAAQGKEEKHFTVPVRDGASEKLIQKPRAKPLDISATVKIKTFKHANCLKDGEDHFDTTVSAFLEKIGAANIMTISPISYAGEKGADFGVVIVYKG